MSIVDMHCDTLSALLEKRHMNHPADLRLNDLQVDIMRLQRSGYLLQNFAVYVDWGKEQNPYQCAMEQIHLFQEELLKNQDCIRLIHSYQEIEENQHNGILSAMLTLEEGEICQGRTERLDEMYALGVRMMTFTWNYENSLASPASPDQRRNLCRKSKGLTEQGFLFLSKMEELGIIADVSHLSDEGIDDVLKHSTKPIVASHSNARSLCPHPRNLTDVQIRGIAERGGVIGTNYYGTFLTTKQENGIYYSKVEDIVRHISHLAEIGGIECVGLGSDFDGMDDNLEISDCSGMERLTDALKKHGFTESQIDKITSKNVLRLYRQILS